MKRMMGVLLIGLLTFFAFAGTAGAASRPEAFRDTAPGDASLVTMEALAAPYADTPYADTPYADTPSPTLGSTPQPGTNPAGDNDGDPADFSQVPLVFGGLAIAVIVIGSIVFYLSRRARRAPRP